MGNKLKLTSDVDVIRREYGFHPINELLAPGIRMDDPKMVTPVIAERGDERILLAREQESGNLTAHGVDWDKVRLFERYVSFDNMVHGSKAAASFAELVKDLASEDNAVVVGGDLPYGRYCALVKAGLDVTVEDSSVAEGSYVVYEVSNSDVHERFQRLRERGPEVARRVIAGRKHLDGLDAHFSTHIDTRFETLDELQKELGADAVLMVAGPNISEVTGERLIPGRVVARTRGSESIFVIAPSRDYQTVGKVVGRFPSLQEAVRSVVGERVTAIEEGYVDVATVQALESAGITHVSASKAFSRWRECRDHEDLTFAVIAAQASRYAMEGALEHARISMEVGKRITELDVYNVYLDLIHNFRAEYDVPFAIAPYFVNCHAADRSVYPALPVDHPLTTATHSLKLDCGVKVYSDGVILGTSDLGRTLVTTDEGKEAYELFLNIVRHDVIEALRPGSVGHEVHTACVDAVLEYEPRLIEIGMMPAGIDLHAEYGRRNVGHLMGKQESFATEFRPGHDYALHEGAIGAVEIQWPYMTHSIAAEDLWFVAPEKTYITSM